MATKAALQAIVRDNLGGTLEKNTVMANGLDACIRQIGELYMFKELITEADVDTISATGTGSCSETTFTSTTEVFLSTMVGGKLVISGKSYEIDTITSTTEVELTTSQTIASGTFTVSAQFIPITTGYDKLLSVGQKGDLQAHPIPIREKKWIDTHYPDPLQMSTGRPIWCYEDGANGRLYFIPFPAAVYSIELTIYTRPTVATAGNTIGVEFDSVLVAYATAYVFNSLEKFDSGASWMREYERLLATAISHHRREPGRVVKATPRPLQLAREDYNSVNDWPDLTELDE